MGALAEVVLCPLRWGSASERPPTLQDAGGRALPVPHHRRASKHVCENGPCKALAGEKHWRDATPWGGHHERDAIRRQILDPKEREATSKWMWPPAFQGLKSLWRAMSHNKSMDAGPLEPLVTRPPDDLASDTCESM